LIEFHLFEEGNKIALGSTKFNISSLNRDEMNENSLLLTSKSKGLTLNIGILQLVFLSKNFGNLPSNIEVQDVYSGIILDQLKTYLIPEEVLRESYQKILKMPFEEDRMTLLISLVEKYYFYCENAAILLQMFRFNAYIIKCFELILPKLLDLKKFKVLLTFLTSPEDVAYIKELALFHYLQHKEISMSKTDSFTINQFNDFTLPNIFQECSIEMVNNPNSPYPIILTNTSNELIQFQHSEKVSDWKPQYLEECFGDISAIIENDLLYIFYVGTNGFLNFKFQSKTGWNHHHESFKEAGKVRGRINVVFETLRAHPAVFFIGEDLFVHYFYFEMKWIHVPFKKIYAKGDISAVYEKHRSSSAFCFEGKDNLLHYYFMSNKNWVHEYLPFSKHPVGGSISMVYNSSSTITSIFMKGSQSFVKCFHLKNGTWTSELEIFKEFVKGDIKACINGNTNSPELLFTTQFGLEHYFQKNGKWEKKLHNSGYITSPLACCYNPNKKANEFCYLTFDGTICYFSAQEGAYHATNIVYQE
jgi:hypothetical protein